MKRCFLSAVMMLTAISMFAATEKMAAFLPGKCEALICVDVTRALAWPGFKDLRTSNKDLDENMVKFEADLKAYQLVPADMVRSIAIYINNKDDSGCVVETAVTEAKLNQMITAGFGKTQKFEIKTEKIGDLSVYSVKPTGETPPELAEKEGAFVYLDATHAIFTQKNSLLKTIEMVKNSPLSKNPTFAGRLKTVNTNAVIWSIFSIPPEMVKKPQPNQPPTNPMDAYLQNVTAGSLSIDIAKIKDIEIAGLIQCKDENSAKMLAQQAQMMLMLISGSALASDPKLSTDFNAAIKINTAATNVNLKMSLTEALQNQLKQFAEKQKTAQLQQESLNAQQPDDNNPAFQPGANAPQPVEKSATAK